MAKKPKKEKPLSETDKKVISALGLTGPKERKASQLFISFWDSELNSLEELEKILVKRYQIINRNKALSLSISYLLGDLKKDEQ